MRRDRCTTLCRWWCIILLISHLSATIDGATFPIPTTNGYRSPDITALEASANPTLARVESPASLAGWFVYAPAPFTGQMFRNASCTGAIGEDCRQRFTLRLINSLDDQFGCGMKRNYTDGGEPIDRNTMLLVQRAGGCFFGTKATNAQALGAGAIMHAGCDPSPPFNCAPGLTITYSRLDIAIPTPYMQFADAYRMRSYLQQRDKYLQGQMARSSSTAQAMSPARSSSSSTGMAGVMFSSSSTGMAGIPAGCPVCNCSASGGSTPTGPSIPTFSDLTQPLVIAFPATGPLDPKEHATLRNIVNNLRSSGGRVDDFPLTRPDANGWTSLRGWNSLADDPQLDPCLYRVVGISCESGHVTALWLFGAGGPVLHGSFDDASWGQFPKLRSLELSNNDLSGPAPQALCNLTSLWMLGLDRQSDAIHVDTPQGLTSLPDCLGNLPLLFFSASTNLIQNVPSTFNSGNGLLFLIMDHNLLTSMPSGFSTQLKGLLSLDFSFNLQLSTSSTTSVATPAMPSFHGWSNLTKLSFGHTALNGALASDAFDGCSAMTDIDFSSAGLFGTLPNFVGCTSLVNILLNDNALTGGIPTTWESLSSVVSLRLQNNQLSAPMTTLSQMIRLTSIWLQNNLIYTTPSQKNDAGVLVSQMAPNNIQEMILDYNRISGTWQSGLLAQTKSFKSFSIAHNQLNSLPADMWNIQIQSWDVSYNNLTGTFPSNTPVINSYLNFLGNPGLVAWPLPSYLVQTNDFVSSGGIDSSYTCRRLIHTALRNLRLEVDATFTDFHGCECVRGTFGNPPLCGSVPERAEVSPIFGFTSQEVGRNFGAMIDQTPDASTSTVTTSTASSNTTTPFTILAPQGFSDQWYGEQRLTLGVSTTWFVKLDNLFYDTEGNGATNSSTTNGGSRSMNTNDGGDSSGVTSSSLSPSDDPNIVELRDASGNITAIASASVDSMARFQPVRIITLQLHISRDLFRAPSDVLFVYEGDPSLSGLRVANLIGTDKFSDPPKANESDSITLTPDYIARYGSQMAAIRNRTLIEVVVFSNAASIHFNSRATSGQHFFATYSYVFACLPSELYFLDSADGVTKCTPVLPRYILSDGIRYAVWVISGLSLAWITLHFIVIVWRWDAPLYRASSRPFLLLTLLFLGAMSLGAMLYAAVPSINPGDSMSEARAVCIGRAWLTCLPLAGILAILWAKTNRVEHIFGSMSLLKAKNVSDMSIVRSIVAICGVEVLFLLIFSFIPLSQPRLAPGSGTLSTSMVNSCSLEPGGLVWVGAQIAWFAILMLAAAALAFKTRNLPSAFNESSHILNSLLVLIFMGAIIVPLDLYVHDQPESAVLLQGLGQAFLVVMVTTIIFGPKLYTVLTVDTAGQKAMMSQSVPGAGGGSASNSNAHATTADGRPSISPIAANRAPANFSRTPSTYRTGGTLGPVAPRPLPQARQPSKMGPTMFPAAVGPTILTDDRIDESGESAASSLADPSQFDGVELASMERGLALLNSGKSFGSSSTPPPEVNETPSSEYEKSQVPHPPRPMMTAPPTPAADSALWRTKSRMSLVLAPISPVAMRATNVTTGADSEIEPPSPPPPPPPPR